MHRFRRLLALVAGALLIAALMVVLLSAPGFLSDRDSTVPVAHPALAFRR